MLEHGDVGEMVMSLVSIIIISGGGGCYCLNVAFSHPEILASQYSICGQLHYHLGHIGSLFGRRIIT